MDDYGTAKAWTEERYDEIAPAPPGAIAEGEIRVRKQLAELEDELSVLVKKVGRFLREPSPMSDSAQILAANPVNRSEFASSLDELATTARRLTVRVRDVAARVDI